MNRDSRRNQGKEEKAAEAADAVPVGAISSSADEAPKRKRTPPTVFLKEVRSELKKVAWPNRKEVTSYTIVVLATTAVLTVIVWGLDEVIKDAVLTIFG